VYIVNNFTGCLEILYSWHAVLAQKLKNCLNIWSVVSLKLVRNCVTFRIQKNGAKKLIFFNLEVLALIFKIYLKIFNGRNYCYNRSRTLILFEYFKISSKKLTFSNLAVPREVSIAYFYFLNFWSKSTELFKIYQEL